MVGPKGLKRRLSVVLQEQEDLLENSEIILDQEPLSDYASRVPNDQGELRKRQRVSVLKQPELNANIFRFDHIPQDELSFNPAADSLPPDRLAPPSNPTAKPVFPDRILPLPVPTGSRRYDPFTAATNAPSRPSPSPYSLGVPPPRTGLSQPPRPHSYPSNMVPATSKIEGSHRTPSRTPPPTTHVVPQYTYANMQAPTAQATWLGSVFQSPDLSIRQPRPRAVSMPYVLSYRSSSSAESQAVGAVVDADAQPLTPQNADPTFPRAQSLRAMLGILNVAILTVGLSILIGRLPILNVAILRVRLSTLKITILMVRLAILKWERGILDGWLAILIRSLGSRP
ncbi:hypothetical protein GMDG_04210 [Pseudogymnoascus destructans 20631-21]|uniref:Uncharacterized protein n=1 Tax=Pseudogymnoascus destructans (strain ATCC MYA-4855 / 20631-21) TaxID=658429 RepID=L8GA24_PSED2|nr:hypothetical protein GMDG_04210 [Pseudogymnoascus destructans 20631-21]